jgi:hypothetical protein
MKVFISWSGERSRVLATALRDWLPLGLHYTEPWFSHEDIGAGQRWTEEVANELDASNFGVLCVTRENVGSAWMLFEAGALAKSLEESRVIPLLLDLGQRDITGPLAQFQAKKVDQLGLLEVVQSLNHLAGPHAVPQERLPRLFGAFWPEFEEKTAAIPEATGPPGETRPQSQVLDDLVAGVRSLESRCREAIEEGQRRRGPEASALATDLGIAREWAEEALVLVRGLLRSGRWGPSLATVVERIGLVHATLERLSPPAGRPPTATMAAPAATTPAWSREGPCFEDLLPQPEDDQREEPGQ